MKSRSLVRLTRSLHAASLRSYISCQSSLPHLSVRDLGKLYDIDKASYKKLNLYRHLPPTMKKQAETLKECVSLVRQPLIEMISWMDATSTQVQSTRAVLWGSFGTGKSMTLIQTLHLAEQKGWVVVHLNSAMNLTRRVAEVEMSSYCPGRINDPVNAAEILTEFKAQNGHIWEKLSALKTTRAYEWTKKDTTNAGKPITEILELGLSTPFLSSDCVGGFFRELRHHATNGDIKMLVSIDDANSLWGKTLVKRADRTFASAGDLTLVEHYRKLIQGDWTNGLIVLVADKKEISDARDHVTVPRDTPMQVFGVEGFAAIEPCIPIETTGYSDVEIKTIHEYFVEKNWLSTKDAQSDRGFNQLKHISAYNPYYFERLCAFV